MPFQPKAYSARTLSCQLACNLAPNSGAGGLALRVVRRSLSCLHLTPWPVAKTGRHSWRTRPGKTASRIPTPVLLLS